MRTLGETSTKRNYDVTIRKSRPTTAKYYSVPTPRIFGDDAVRLRTRRTDSNAVLRRDAELILVAFNQFADLIPCVRDGLACDADPAVSPAAGAAFHVVADHWSTSVVVWWTPRQFARVLADVLGCWS